MEDERSHWKIITIAVLAWIGVVAIPSFWQMSLRGSAAETKFYVEMPAMSQAEVEAMLVEIRADIAKPSGDPATYFKTLRKIGLLDEQCSRMRYVPDDAALMKEARRWYCDSQSRIYKDDLHGGYQLLLGTETMSEYARQQGAGGNYFVIERRPPMAKTGDLWFAVWRSWLVVGAFVMLLRLDAAGHSIVVELLAPWRLALAVFFSPMSFFFYPKGTRTEQLVHGLRFATFALGSILSGGVGVAKAETAKGSGGKKKDSKRDWSLRFDARAGRLIENASGPNPNGLLRATITAPSKLFLETITVVRSDFCLNSTVVGRSLKRTGPFVLNAVGGTVVDSKGNASLVGGLQLFGQTKRFRIELPDFGVERKVSPKPATTFVETARLYLRYGRLRLGGQVAMRKPLEPPTSWTVGPIVGFSTRKGSVFEGNCLKSGDDWRAGIRFVRSFSW